MLIMNVVLNFLLIPRYHIIGAAIATSVSYCLITILPFFLMQKMRLIYGLLLKRFLIFWPSLAVVIILFSLFGRNQLLEIRVAIYIFIFLILVYLNRNALASIFPKLLFIKKLQK